MKEFKEFEYCGPPPEVRVLSHATRRVSPCQLERSMGKLVGASYADSLLDCRTLESILANELRA